MAVTSIFEPGGYRYIRGPFQYSGGVAAEPGFTIERVRFVRPLALDEGFKRVEAHLKTIGRPLTSLCACELRSPAPFSEQGFVDFNRVYVGTLERWGLFSDEENPVARSNVCPEFDGPPEPSVHAFSYTVIADHPVCQSFVIAGSAEVKKGDGPFRDRIICRGDTTPDALRQKARHVLNTMETRMLLLDAVWGDSTATHVYTVHDLHPFLREEIVASGAAASEFTWVYARPPVVGLDYEMDVRSVYTEHVVAER
jgi:hypothetical protein